MADPRAVPITLSEAFRATLQSWTRRRRTAQGLALRARIVLECAELGVTNLAVAARLGISNLTAGKWRRRFAEQGIKGLSDAPRPGVPRRILDEQIERAITTILESVPRGATHWSTRLLARELGMSQTVISRIWRAFALAPHRSETFKLSTDPHFIDLGNGHRRAVPQPARPGARAVR
jgi:transposase